MSSSACPKAKVSSKEGRLGQRWVGSGLLPEQLQGEAFTVVHAGGSAGTSSSRTEWPACEVLPEADRGRDRSFPGLRKPAEFSHRPQCHLGKKEETGGRALAGS